MIALAREARAKTSLIKMDVMSRNLQRTALAACLWLTMLGPVRAHMSDAEIKIDYAATKAKLAPFREQAPLGEMYDDATALQKHEWSLEAQWVCN